MQGIKFTERLKNYWQTLHTCDLEHKHFSEGNCTWWLYKVLKALYWHADSIVIEVDGYTDGTQWL